MLRIPRLSLRFNRRRFLKRFPRFSFHQLVALVLVSALLAPNSALAHPLAESAIAHLIASRVPSAMSSGVGAVLAYLGRAIRAQNGESPRASRPRRQPRTPHKPPLSTTLSEPSLSIGLGHEYTTTSAPSSQ